MLDRIGVPVKLELPGVGENVQEHICAVFSVGASRSPVCWTPTTKLTRYFQPELREDVPFETWDLLLNPATLQKHMELL